MSLTARSWCTGTTALDMAVRAVVGDFTVLSHSGWVCDVPGLAPRPSGERNAKLSLLGDGVVPLQATSAFRTCLDRIATRLSKDVAA